MKKALALVLALVLALSMAVSAFAAVTTDGFVLLTPAPVAPDDKLVIPVVAAAEYTLFVYEGGTYYVALEDLPYTDLAVTANGCASAELIDYDPTKMDVIGMDIYWGITYRGELTGEYFVNDYEAALAAAAAYNDAEHVTYYNVALCTNVNIIKITVEDNYTAHFLEGTISITGKLAGVAVSGVLTVINDVSIFEYEEVKWAAANFGRTDVDAFLSCIDSNMGYSDYLSYLYGYDTNGDGEYDWWENYYYSDVAVLSTTGFRAIQGKDIMINCEDKIFVSIYDVAAGQKGVNFKCYTPYAVDENNDGFAEAIAFGFYGDQVIASDFNVNVRLGLTYFTIREVFGIKVEEDDIIDYYILKDGKLVQTVTVDYKDMTNNLNDLFLVDLDLSNTTLGQYEIVLSVPAAEGESNPNTGAESVVGVVAALAVVSLASAAAISLKK